MPQTKNRSANSPYNRYDEGVYVVRGFKPRDVAEKHSSGKKVEALEEKKSPLDKFPAATKNFIEVSRKITLLEILKDEGYARAVAMSLKSEEPFVKNFKLATGKEVDSELASLYKRIIKPKS